MADKMDFALKAEFLDRLTRAGLAIRGEIYTGYLLFSFRAWYTILYAVS